MNKKQRTRGVDDQIRDNLKEPDRYAFSGVHETGNTVETNDDPTFNENALFRMTDAALAGRLGFYEKEHLFARGQHARDEAQAEVIRTKGELTRRKNKMYSAAVEQAFLAEDHKTTVAANDTEANWQRATRKEAA